MRPRAPNPQLQHSPEFIRQLLRWSVIVVPGLIWGVAFVCWLIIPTPFPNLDGLTFIGIKYFRPDYDVGIYVASGAVAILIASVLKYLAYRPAIPVVAAGTNTLKQSISRVIDLLAVATVLCTVIVVSPAELTERGFDADAFHHLNFFLMGPLQAFRHGAALGTDVYSQYGSGWVLVFTVIGLFFRLDYQIVIGLLPVFGAIYFLSVYFLLRLLTKSATWSFVGVLACLQFQLFTGTDHPIWLSPSSSVLRCPLDMALAATLLLLPFKPRLAAIGAGCLGGLSLLFGTDTGIYVALSLMLFTFLSILGTRSVANAKVLGLLWASYATVLIAGLSVVSRGTMWQSRFWKGYFESLLEYGGGFGALPVSDAIVQPLVALLLFGILMLYTLTIANAFAASARQGDFARANVLAVIATIGLGTLMLFINRSHPYNLFHPIVPAIVLLTQFLARRSATDEAATTIVKWLWQERVATIVGSILVFLLFINPKLWDYPSVAAKVASQVSDDDVAEQPRNFALFSEKVKTIEKILHEFEKLNRVEFVGEDITSWIVALDRGPMGRYCPTLLIHERQKEKMVEDFRKSNPQVAFLITFPEAYGANPNYFDDAWKALYSDPELTIQINPEVTIPPYLQQAKTDRERQQGGHSDEDDKR